MHAETLRSCQAEMCRVVIVIYIELKKMRIESHELAFVSTSLHGRRSRTLPNVEKVFRYFLSGLDSSPLPVCLRLLLLLLSSR